MGWSDAAVAGSRPEARVSRRPRPVGGVLASAGVALAMVPMHLVLSAVAVMSAGRFDSSGGGGPFRSCRPDSVACSGPEYWVIAGTVLIAVVTWWCAGLAGQAVGRFEHVWAARIALAAMSMPISVGGAIGIWWLR